ncbi:hypothetical protein Moror_13740 [Moniliophthora roreri MCA 2997]|uniref:Uncharacterized protein n=1 Tax=Moniliophthora roreri (strain MCA 2997) TaxID=1381753 RepID=V2XBW8_MONRO|nr:hypothetical protein Moror_13740 [Moniliophthora roreri MCA 2997]
MAERSDTANSLRVSTCRNYVYLTWVTNPSQTSCSIIWENQNTRMSRLQRDWISYLDGPATALSQHIWLGENLNTARRTLSQLGVVFFMRS